MARNPKPAGSEQDNDEWAPSDESLGIGIDDAPAPASDATTRIDAAMSDPVIAAAFAELVEKRAAEMAAASTPSGASEPSAMLVKAMEVLAEKMAGAINRSTAATMEQIPGHVKPIPAEEVEKRAAAWVELQSLLADTARRYWTAIEKNEHVEAERLTPLYLLGEDFFGPGEVGSEMYVRGETIRWFGAPGIFMEPRNGIAKTLCDLMWDYLGNEGAPSAEDLAAKASQMMRPSTPGAALPEMPLLLSARGRGRPNASRVTELGIAERGPDNIVGTVVKVTRGGFGHAPVQPVTGPHQIRGPVLAGELV